MLLGLDFSHDVANYPFKFAIGKHQFTLGDAHTSLVFMRIRPSFHPSMTVCSLLLLYRESGISNSDYP